MNSARSGWRSVQSTRDALNWSGEADVSDGFLPTYAATSVENEFDTYVATLVTYKILLLIGAHGSLDPHLRLTVVNLGFGHLPIDGYDKAVPIHIQSTYLPPAPLSRGQ